MANNRYCIVEKLTRFTDESWGAFGTPSTENAIDQISEDISEEHGFVYTETSAKRTRRNRLLGPRMAGGEIAVPLYSVGTPTLLYYALGSSVAGQQNDGAGTPQPIASYKHTIKQTGSVVPFRLAVGKDLNEHRFVGCAVKSVKLDYSLNEPALATFDLLVRKELAPGALQTPDFPDYDIKNRAFTGVEVTADLDGSPVSTVRSFSLDLDNGLQDNTHSFGDRYLQDLRAQTFTASGNITIAFNDITQYNNVLNESESSLKLSYSQGAANSVERREFNVELPKISYDTVKLPTDANNEYILDLSFTCQTDPTSAATKAKGQVLIECLNELADIKY